MFLFVFMLNLIVLLMIIFFYGNSFKIGLVFGMIGDGFGLVK